MVKEAFYITDAPDHEDRGLRLGLAWLLKWGERTDDGVIVMPGKAQFGRGYGLGEVIGERAAKSLGKGERVATDAGRHLRGYSASTLPKYSRHGPVLAVWLGEAALAKVADCDAPALCVVPYVRAEGEVWARGVGALDLVTGEPLQSGVHDPVVSQALQSVTRTNNMASPLGHPLDKSRAVKMFKILKAGGHGFTRDQVYELAIALKWNAKHAQDLADMAQKILDGKKLHAKHGGWADDILDQWRASASDEE